MADFDPSGVWEASSMAGTVMRFDIGPVQPNGSFSGSANITGNPGLGTGQGSGGRLAACLYSRLIGLTELHTCLAAGLLRTVS